ncbi:hypothetical protein GW17_00057755 [Ensete ventricosum]|nr:hypothetical protein GW17_00057755 [Ensete ventricosum]RZR82144.1 hypothetical protein BHM03_00008508 [Ensete ventricosum]
MCGWSRLWERIGGPSSHSSGICQVRLSFASTGLGYSYKIFLLDRSQETGSQCKSRTHLNQFLLSV